MHITAHRLNQLPVMSLQDEGVAGHVTEPIIDPANLAVVAFACSLPEGAAAAVLLATDVRQLSEAYAVINSSDDLAGPEDIVRLKELLKAHYNPMKKPVETDSGRKLGRVFDYAIDLESMRVQKLMVRPPLLSLRRFVTSVIDRTQIVDISPARIVVRDVTVHAGLLTGETSPQGTT